MTAHATALVPRRERFQSGCAFDGSPLAGDNLVRMIFLDEAGISNPAQEPFLVVAGVMIDADKQWQAVQRRLAELANKHAPEGAMPDFSFHAMELWHGNKNFPRHKYDREQRWSILDELIGVIWEFDLPVIHAAFEREQIPDFVEAYGFAFGHALSDAEAYMRVQPDKNAVASVVFDDNAQVRRSARFAQESLQQEANLQGLRAHEKDRFWLTHIVGLPHFENRSYSSPLQLADACAFVLKRVAMGKQDVKRFSDVILRQVVTHNDPRTDREWKKFWESRGQPF